MSTFALYSAIAVGCVLASCVAFVATFSAIRALTPSRPVLTPGREEGPAAGDAAGPSTSPQ